MPAKLRDLVARGLATPHLNGLENLIQYEAYVGSSVYGVTSDTSDLDIISFAIPPKDNVFPHLNGYIMGFGSPPPIFETYQQHHMLVTEELGGKGREYDYTCYNIVKYFDLLAHGNPTLLDSLFVPARAILFMTPIGQLVRENRWLFLHKGCTHRYLGYSYQQLTKMKTKNPTVSSKRKDGFDKWGYDLKFGLHIVRLLLQLEQILTEKDLDLERNSDILKSIRNGEWTFEQIEAYFRSNEKRLLALKDSSDLPHSPDMDKIKNILIQCLELHFGNLDTCITIGDPAATALKEVNLILDKYKKKYTL